MFFVQRRGVSCGSLGGLGCQSVGCPGPALRLPHSLSLCSFSLPCPTSPSELFPFLHQGYSFGRCGCRPAGEGCGRAGSLFSRLLQASLCHSQVHRGVASCNRSLAPQPFRRCLISIWRPLSRCFIPSIWGIGWYL